MLHHYYLQYITHKLPNFKCNAAKFCSFQSQQWNHPIQKKQSSPSQSSFLIIILSFKLLNVRISHKACKWKLMTWNITPKPFIDLFTRNDERPQLAIERWKTWECDKFRQIMIHGWQKTFKNTSTAEMLQSWQSYFCCKALHSKKINQV